MMLLAGSSLFNAPALAQGTGAAARALAQSARAEPPTAPGRSRGRGVHEATITFASGGAVVAKSRGGISIALGCSQMR